MYLCREGFFRLLKGQKKRKLIFPIILTSAVLLLLFNDMGIIKWYQLRQERQNIQMDIERLILEEINLTNEINRLETDEEYIKNIARERFHMVEPGEKVFRVVDRRKVKKDK